MIKWLLVVVLIFVAGVGGYLYLVRYEPVRRGLEEGSATEGIIMINEPLLEDIAWGNEDFVQVGFNGVSYSVKLFTDGVPIWDEIEILDDAGGLLATAVMSIKGYYRDGDGVGQSVLFPQMIRTREGKLYQISMAQVVDWPEQNLRVEVEKNPKEFNLGIDGLAVYVTVASDVEVVREKFREMYPETALPQDYDAHLKLIDEYNRSKSGILQSFLREGDPALGVLLPLSVEFGVEEIVDLDGGGYR